MRVNTTQVPSKQPRLQQPALHVASMHAAMYLVPISSSTQALRKCDMVQLYPGIPYRSSNINDLQIMVTYYQANNFKTEKYQQNLRSYSHKFSIFDKH
jgi:hypothetical protein